MAKKYQNVRERNGKHYYRYSIKDAATGKRVQKETPGFATGKQAYQAGIKIQAELLSGTYIEEESLSFTDWCDRWLEIYAASGKVKRRSVDVRRGSLSHPRKRFAGLKLKELTKLQYQAMLSDMKNAGYAKSTISILHEAMRMMFRKAVQLELIKTDITKGAEVPAFRKTVQQLEEESDIPRYLEKEELSLLLQAAREYGNDQFYRALWILAYTGMRIGELCALKLSDIDKTNKQISITKTLISDKGVSNFEIGTPKTSSSARKIDVSEKILAVLAEQIAWRQEHQKATLSFYSKEDFIFINVDSMPGMPLSSRRFQEYIKNILALACLPLSITPHSLRHTYTSLMAEAGVDLTTIQRLLGHRNADITARVYLHVTKAKKLDAVGKLELLMDGIE